MPDEKSEISKREAEHFLEIAEPSAVELAEKRAVELHTEKATSEGITPATPASSLAQTLPTPISSEKTELRLDIERVLEEDLSYMYSQLNEKQRVQFRDEGEKVAEKLEKIVAGAKIKMQEIIGLIREWLLLIPGMNQFFIDQEAKIKAEKIISMKDLNF